MPETTIHKNHRTVSRKYDIWFTGQVRSVKPEAISRFMECRAHYSLWRCVFPTDATHYPASFRSAEYVACQMTLLICGVSLIDANVRDTQRLGNDGNIRQGLISPLKFLPVV
jgi:hypothetical protein